MKKFTKLVGFLILALGLSLAWVDSRGIDDFFSHNEVNASKECDNFSGNSMHQYFSGMEDNFINSDSKLKSGNFYKEAGIVPVLHINFENSFSASIWQPPKVS